MMDLKRSICFAKCHLFMEINRILILIIQKGAYKSRKSDIHSTLNVKLGNFAQTEACRMIKLQLAQAPLTFEETQT